MRVLYIPYGGLTTRLWVLITLPNGHSVKQHNNCIRVTRLRYHLKVHVARLHFRNTIRTDHVRHQTSLKSLHRNFLKTHQTFC